MDKILNSKSFKLLKKSGSHLASISFIAYVIWQEYIIKGEGNTFIVGVMVTLLSIATISSILDVVLTYFNE